MTNDDFDELIGLALKELPPELARHMRNVGIFVEDERPGIPNLLGLYEGIPLTRRGNHYTGVLPDRITIYRRSILRYCRTREDVVHRVKVTVIHEIAHHFGISDARLHELGWA